MRCEGVHALIGIHGGLDHFLLSEWWSRRGAWRWRWWHLVVVAVALNIRGGRRRDDGGGRRWNLLALLLLVADPARARLVVAHLAEVEPDGAGAEGVVLGAPAVLLVRGAEAAHERVEAAPGLAQRARARRGRRGVAEEGAPGGVHLGLAELVEVAQELEHVRAAAPRQRQRRAVVPQVLPERVPVATLLRLVPARRRPRRRRAGPGRRHRRHRAAAVVGVPAARVRHQVHLI
jgi:hypothetical protein